MPFANRQTVQTLLLEFVRIATAFLAACGHGQRQQTRPTCPRSCPTQAHGHHAQHPAPRPRHHHGQTITEGDGHGQRPRGRATRSTADTDGRRRNTPAPSPAASRSTQQEPPPVSQPTGPEPSSPARLPSMLYPVQIDGERSRQGERERGKEEGAAPAHLENRRHSHNTEPRPALRPPAVTGHLEPPRSRLPYSQHGHHAAAVSILLLERKQNRPPK